MDVDSALALAATAAASAASEAGRQAWQSLVSLARRATGRGPGEPLPADPATGPDDPVPAGDDPAAVRTLQLRLVTDQARRDPDFAAQLCQWAARHQAALQGQRVDAEHGQVHNRIGDGARIQGPVIQTGNVTGGINLSS